MKVAQKVLARGPKHLIIKRGEYGVLMFNEKQVFGAPAFPSAMPKPWGPDGYIRNSTGTFFFFRESL